MVSRADQYKWMKLGGAMFVVLLFCVLIKPALESVAAVAQNGPTPASHSHANVLRRGRGASHGEHTRTSLVDRAVMEECRAILAFISAKPRFDLVACVFACFAALLALCAAISASLGRRRFDPITDIVSARQSLVYLSTQRLRI